MKPRAFHSLFLYLSFPERIRFLLCVQSGFGDSLLWSQTLGALEEPLFWEPPQSRAAVGEHVFHIFWEGFYFIWHGSQHGSIFTVITHVLCHRSTSATLKRWHLHICVVSIRDGVNYAHMPAILSARPICSSVLTINFLNRLT